MFSMMCFFSYLERKMFGAKKSRTQAPNLLVNWDGISHFIIIGCILGQFVVGIYWPVRVALELAILEEHCSSLIQ